MKKLRKLNSTAELKAGDLFLFDDSRDDPQSPYLVGFCHDGKNALVVRDWERELEPELRAYDLPVFDGCGLRGNAELWTIEDDELLAYAMRLILTEGKSHD